MAEQRHDVQGLRAVAIFAVLLFHFYPEFFPNGYLGVDVFFVISGFLICTILNKCESFGIVTFANFYYRRVKRILPLYLVYVCIAVLLFTYHATPTTILDNQRSSIGALLFFTNIQSLFAKDDYFKRLLSDNLFTHTWSLSVEVQFYFLVPFIFLFRSWSPHGGNIVLPLLSALSLILFIVSPAVFSFNVTFARIWQFFPTFLLPQEDRLLPSWILPQTYQKLPQEEGDLVELSPSGVKREPFSPSRRPLPVTALYHVSLLMLLLPLLPVPLESTSARIVVIAATAVIIVYGKGHENVLLSSRPFEFIGDISYSLYLFHWPFSVYFVKSTAVFSVGRLSLIPIAVLLTIAIYFAFERYYRQWSKEVTGIFVFFFYMIAIFLIVRAPYLNNQLFEAKMATHSKNITEAIRQNEYVFAHAHENLFIAECEYSFWRNMSGPQYENHVKKPLGMCKMPNGSGKLKFAVIGNSYAPNQADLVWKHFKPFYSTFTLFSQSSCEVFTYTHSGYCGHFVNYTDVMDEIKPDVTFIIQRYGAPKNPLHPPGEADPELKEMIDHMNDIKNKSHLFYIMDSFPAFNYYEFLNMNEYIRQNMTAEEINLKIVVREEDKTARPRTKQLVETCKEKCRLYDVEPGLLNAEGNFCALDPNTSLALFEPSGHLAPWGRQNIEYIYADLANQYDKELTDLSKKLYP